VLLRPGAISEAQLKEVLPSIGERTPASPRHSGGLERHYAPRTPASLVPSHELDREISRLKNRAAVLAFSRPDERVDFWLRMPREPRAYAQKLYASLRELDTAGCARILVEAPPETPEWRAVRDRLRRACGTA
jgi:L-threonylcarbamoyladenylate synthase